MAESTKEQVKNQKTILELLNGISKKAIEIRETFEKQKDAAQSVETVFAAQQARVEGLSGILDKTREVEQKAQQNRIDLEMDYMYAKEEGDMDRAAQLEARIIIAREEQALAEKSVIFAENGLIKEQERLEIQEKIKDSIQGQADNMKKLGDKISGVFSAIPGGATISKFLGLDTLGDD